MVVTEDAESLTVVGSMACAVELVELAARDVAEALNAESLAVVGSMVCAVELVELAARDVAETPKFGVAFTRQSANDLFFLLEAFGAIFEPSVPVVWSIWRKATLFLSSDESLSPLNISPHLKLVYALNVCFAKKW